MVRLSAYAGLRLGELLALRRRNVDFAGQVITVGRAMSAGVETSTKSGRIRRVPLADPAAAALDRVSRRADYIGPDERVFCNALGRTLDHSRSGAASVARRLRLSCDPCAGMTCATPTARSWPPTASIW
jgi:integrase